MTLKNNRAPLLCFVNLRASFQSHRRSQTFVFVPCDLEIWWRTLKTIEHLFYITSSCVHHVVAISGLQLELQSGNPNLGQNRRFFGPYDLEIWQMTLKKRRHLFYATACILHHSVAIDDFKVELQSGNAQFGPKSSIFRPVWPWPLTSDHDLLHGHSVYQW